MKTYAFIPTKKEKEEFLKCLYTLEDYFEYKKITISRAIDIIQEMPETKEA